MLTLAVHVGSPPTSQVRSFQRWRFVYWAGGNESPPAFLRFLNTAL